MKKLSSIDILLDACLMIILFLLLTHDKYSSNLLYGKVFFVIIIILDGCTKEKSFYVFIPLMCKLGSKKYNYNNAI
jgi:hypothetical protein